MIKIARICLNHYVCAACKDAKHYNGRQAYEHMLWHESRGDEVQPRWREELSDLAETFYSNDTITRALR